MDIELLEIRRCNLNNVKCCLKERNDNDNHDIDKQSDENSRHRNEQFKLIDQICRFVGRKFFLQQPKLITFDDGDRHNNNNNNNHQHSECYFCHQSSCLPRQHRHQLQSSLSSGYHKESLSSSPPPSSSSSSSTTTMSLKLIDGKIDVDDYDDNDDQMSLYRYNCCCLKINPNYPLYCNNYHIITENRCKFFQKRKSV